MAKNVQGKEYFKVRLDHRLHNIRLYISVLYSQKYERPSSELVKSVSDAIQPTALDDTGRKKTKGIKGHGRC